MEEETSNEKEIIISRPPSLREPYSWLVISDGENNERHTFYSITENRYYVRFVPELQNKYVMCCYKGLLVLRDKVSHDCSLLNILTMEKVQLPPLPDLHFYHYCAVSSSIMDGRCRIIVFEPAQERFWSCHVGDSRYKEGVWTYINDVAFLKAINFGGKLHALACVTLDLVTCDFSDPYLGYTKVISGESLKLPNCYKCFYLVDSCGELLLVCAESLDYEIAQLKIFKADFSSREWVGLENIGDRVIFLNTPLVEDSSGFSSPASAFGLKGNAVYWVNEHGRNLYVYDLEDNTVSVSLPCPIVKHYSSLFWVSCLSDEIEIPTHQKTPLTSRSYMRNTGVTTGLQKGLKDHVLTETKEDIASVGGNENSFADLPDEILCDIFSRLFAGDRIVFGSVCRLWNSISTLPATPVLGCPHSKLDRFSGPYLTFSNKIFDPIYGKYDHFNFLDMPGIVVRYSREDWLLMSQGSERFFFYNAFTKAKVILPVIDVLVGSYSVSFSSPPTSTDWRIVAAVRYSFRRHAGDTICSIKSGDVTWTDEVNLDYKMFNFSCCSPVHYKGLYYFLGKDAELLIYDPIKKRYRIREAPKFIPSDWAPSGEQYMLVSEGKLLAVFVCYSGSAVHVCQWNVSKRIWETLTSLGNRMLFVSHVCSLSVPATVKGTGNKIYFPRLVGDDILFYSMATKKYHTFAMDASYKNFYGSKGPMWATWIGLGSHLDQTCT